MCPSHHSLARVWFSLGAVVLAGCSLAGDAATEEAAPAAPAAAQAVAPVRHANWPVYRGNALGTGVAESTLPETPELLWKFKTDGRSFESAAAIVDGVVYVGDRGNSDGKLYALDLQTGAKRWEFTAEANILAPAAVGQGRVFFGDMDGKFYALEAATGKKAWDFVAQAEIDGGANFWQGKVLFGAQDATLYCLTPEKGELVWQFAISDQIRCTPTVVEDRAFVAGCDAKLHIIDLTRGAEVAAVPIESPTGVTPAVLGDLVFFGTQGGAFFAINWKTAAIAWQDADASSSTPYDGSPAVYAPLGLVVAGGQGKKLSAFRVQDGGPGWTYPLRAKMEASPVIAGTRVYFGGNDGRLTAVDLQSGKEVWKREVSGKIIGSPAVADGRLVVGTDAGELYCFGAKP